MNLHCLMAEEVLPAISVSVDGDNSLHDKYDFYIYSLGYEERCTHLPRSLAHKDGEHLAFAFDFHKNSVYRDNKKWYEDTKIKILDIRPEEIEVYLLELLDGFSTGSISTVFFDCSSFSREYIANFLASFNYIAALKRILIEVTIGYSEACYVKPGYDSPIAHTGPVTPDFAGWPKDPALPSECIIGLGYEEGRALGAMEYIEPNSTWFFRPVGTDSRFLESLKKANAQLYQFNPDVTVIDYDLDSPYATFLTLESLVVSYIDRARPVLVPFGPKPFFVSCALVSLRHRNDVSVWRVSSCEQVDPINRIASGKCSYLRATFSPL